MLQQYLQRLGFSEKEQAIYLVLTEIGVQPASIIARRCGLDRVTTYKHLKRLAERGFVKVYHRDAMQCFGVEKFEALQEYLREEVARHEKLLQEFPTVENLLASRRGGDSLVPKLQIFEGEAGMKGFFRDIVYEAKEQHLQQIRMLTSNTFEERLGDVPLSRFVDEFFADIRKCKLDVEILEASGTLIPERVRAVSFTEFQPEKFPAARGTTSIFLVGSCVYLACYKDTQIGMKIKQAEMSQIFHFLFDVVGRSAE